MLSLSFIREHPDLVKDGARKKGEPAPVDEIVQLDAQRRETLTRLEQLKAEQNRRSAAMAKARDQAAIDALRGLKDEVKALEQKLAPIDAHLNALHLEEQRIEVGIDRRQFLLEGFHLILQPAQRVDGRLVSGFGHRGGPPILLRLELLEPRQGLPSLRVELHDLIDGGGLSLFAGAVLDEIRMFPDEAKAQHAGRADAETGSHRGWRAGRSGWPRAGRRPGPCRRSAGSRIRAP